MKTCSEIRRENLERLIAEFGKIETIADLTGMNSSYISQIRTQSPNSKTKKLRVMGDTMARRLETGVGKEIGWMDHDHSLNATLLAVPAILHAAQAMAVMEPEARYLAVRLVDQVAQPASPEIKLTKVSDG